jgi:antitoxin component HigA of HigAB toxin-antitoxin module
MVLLKRNLILNYIEHDPKGRTALLLLIIRYRERIQTDELFINAKDVLHGSANLGIDDLILRYKLNPYTKAFLPTWYGEKADYSKHLENLSPGNNQEIKIVTISSTVKFPVKFNPVTLKVETEAEKIAVFPPDSNKLPNKFDDITSIHSIEEYDQLLEDVLGDFDIKPDNKDFDNHLYKINQIEEFENRYFLLPKIKLNDIVKYRMKQRIEGPEMLIKILGDEENVELFYQGKLMLTDSLIIKLRRTFQIPESDEILI